MREALGFVSESVGGKGKINRRAKHLQRILDYKARTLCEHDICYICLVAEY